MNLILKKIEQCSNIIFKKVNLCDIAGNDFDLKFINEIVFDVVQCIEIWNSVGSWVESNQPTMGPRIADAMNHFRNYDRSLVNMALQYREIIRQIINMFLGDDKIFCFPTVPMIPPLVGELNDWNKCKEYYQWVMWSTSLSSVASLPEVTLPLVKIDDVPVGISLAARRGNDEFLVDCADIITKLYQK